MRRRGIRSCLLLAVVAIVLPVAGCGSGGRPIGEGVSRPLPSSERALRWTKLPQAPLGPRYEADGVWVAGRFVVVGGWGGPACPDTASCAAPADPALRGGAAFDPVSRAWRTISDAPVPVSGLNAVAAGGRIFLLTPDQGRADSPASFLGYDPAGDTWTAYPMPPRAGRLVAVGSTVAVVPDSDETTRAVDAVFDPGDSRWHRLPDDPLGPSFDRAAVAVDGGLLLTAKDLVADPGSTRPALVRLARLDLDHDLHAGRWMLLPDSEIIGWGPVSVGNLVVWPSTGSADGGQVNGWGRSYPEGGIYDPADGSWRALPGAPDRSPGSWCCSGAVLRGRVLVSDHLLDPVAGRWTSLPGLPGRERRSAAVASGPDAVLVWGGSGAGSSPTNLADGYLLSP